MPKAFGEFKNDVRFRRICLRCNKAIGKCEEQLIRAGPEAFLHRLLCGVEKRAGASGVPPPRDFRRHDDGHFEYVRPRPFSVNDGTDVEPVDQIAFTTADGEPKYVEMFPKMSPSTVRQRAEARGWEPKLSVWVHAKVALMDEIVGIARAAFPESPKFDELPRSEPGYHRVRGMTRAIFSEDYYRAVAKIAFHYFLTRSWRGVRGSEGPLTPLRDFIRSGKGRPEGFLREPQVFAPMRRPLPDGRQRVAKSTFHMCAIAEVEEPFVVMVELFNSPLSPGNAYELVLPRGLGTLVAPGAVHGSMFLYESIRGKPYVAKEVVPVSRDRYVVG